jgi:hypothetical protein
MYFSEKNDILRLVRGVKSTDMRNFFKLNDSKSTKIVVFSLQY